MHIHILGICGTFMGGLAVLARAAGYEVTGCDTQVYPPMSTQLERQGIKLIEGFDPGQLALRPDLFVVGNVVSRGNPLMEEILNQGLPYRSGPQWLAHNILGSCRVLAVAGTHGKTTTAALLAWILDRVGAHPGFLIGGVPLDFECSARLPASWHPAPASSPTQRPWFVIEADEYDTAFFDKRSKFVHYQPWVAILNNLEYDHADIFPSLAAIQQQFHHLIRTVPEQGLLVVNGSDQALAETLSQGSWTPQIEFGCRTSGWRLERSGSGVALWNGHELCAAAAEWPLWGAHNLANGAAALAAAQGIGIDPVLALAAAAQFNGVRRRMELRGTVRGISVYDDFAHHPTAIATTIAGLRANCAPAARILAVIEPRSNTMRSGVWAQSLAPSLEGADLVFCYCAQLDWDVSAALAKLGGRVCLEVDLTRLTTAIVGLAQPGDQILVMSNGEFGGLHEHLLHQLSAGGANAHPV